MHAHDVMMSLQASWMLDLLLGPNGTRPIGRGGQGAVFLNACEDKAVKVTLLASDSIVRLSS